MIEQQDYSTHRLEEKFFSGARVVKLEIDVLEEMRQRALDVFESMDLTPDEGFRVVLARGVAQLYLDSLAGSEPQEPLSQSEAMVRRLMDVEAGCAVMKFRTFHLMKDNQALEWRKSALRATVSGLEAQLASLRNEHARLAAGDAAQHRAEGNAAPGSSTP